MRNYAADEPITLQNPEALIQATGCVDKNENLFNGVFGKNATPVP